VGGKLRIPADTIEFRILRGEEYVKALARSSTRHWPTEFSVHQSGVLSLPESLALVYPRHYEDLVSAEKVRGPRHFDAEIGKEPCRAEIIWGYRCNAQAASADHLFPYSLGGPTIASNKVHLCRFHNEMKSNDIHLFPWELGRPLWLAQCLQAIRMLMGA
jgi:hypothetical protein